MFWLKCKSITSFNSLLCYSNFWIKTSKKVIKGNKWKNSPPPTHYILANTYLKPFLGICLPSTTEQRKGCELMPYIKNSWLEKQREDSETRESWSNSAMDPKIRPSKSQQFHKVNRRKMYSTRNPCSERKSRGNQVKKTPTL